MDAVHELAVPPHERVRLTTHLVPTRRGDRVADRVTVRVLGPLGLAARQRSVPVPGSIRALHPFPSRKHLPSRLAVLRQLDGRAAVRIRGQGTEFDSLREYVEGDDVRSIDWRATARRQHLVVRTWQPEQHRRVVIVLDTSRTSAGRIGDAPRLDAAMDAALLLTALAGHARDRVQVIAGDRVVHARISGTDRARLLHDTISNLAPVEPRLVEADWSALATEVVRLGTHRALVVLLTSLESSAIEEGLLPVLPALAAHHRVVVASVSDPALADDARRADHHRRGLRRGRRGAHGRAAEAHGIRARAARRRRHRRRTRRPAGAPGRPLPDAQAPGPALSRMWCIANSRKAPHPASGCAPDRVADRVNLDPVGSPPWGCRTFRNRGGRDMQRRRPVFGVVLTVVGAVAASTLTMGAAKAAPAPAASGATAVVAPAKAPVAQRTSAAEARRVDRVKTPRPDWFTCEPFAPNAECATVPLPLDYDKPSGPTTDVAVLRIPARDPARRIGTLFLNPGGPGAPVEIAAAAPGFLGADLLDRFDIMGFDPRGTNYSDNVKCWSNLGQQYDAISRSSTSPSRTSAPRFAPTCARRRTSGEPARPPVAPCPRRCRPPRWPVTWTSCAG